MTTPVPGSMPEDEGDEDRPMTYIENSGPGGDLMNRDDLDEAFKERFRDGTDRETYFREAVELPPSKTVLAEDPLSDVRGMSLAKEQWAVENRLDAAACSDLHGVLFEPDIQFSERTTAKLRKAWVDAFVKDPNLETIRADTVLDVGMTEIAVGVIARQYVLWEASLPPEVRERIEGGGKLGTKDRAGIKKSASSAAGHAAGAVEEMAGCAAGLGPGGDGKMLDGKRTKEIFQKIKKNKLLRRILEICGKYRCKAAGVRRSRTIHGMDDMVDIGLGGDLSALIPTELMKMKHPKLRLELYARLMEGQATMRKYASMTKEQNGPIVVVVDESGSMSGEPHDNAKAFALAMGWVARNTNRWIGFVGFSGGSEGTRIAFPPGKWDQDKLIDWLCHFYGGGTSLDVPLDELPNKYMAELGAPKGRTDVILITDAYVEAPDGLVAQYNNWAEENKATTYGIIIGAEPGDLTRVCKRTWTVDKFDVDSNPVEELFAI